MHRQTSLIAFATTLACATTAFAQPKEVSLTTEQIELNNKAVKALRAKQPDVAIDYMRAALREKGDHGNVLYLTLGRAHQLKGQCKVAKTNFSLSQTKPRVKGVPEDFVSKRLVKYRSQMAELCPGEVVIQCKDPGITLSMVNTSTKTPVMVKKKAPRCGDRFTLDKGTYKITGMAKGVEKTETQHVNLTITGDALSTAQLTIERPGKKVVEFVVPTKAIVIGASSLVVAGGLWGYHFYARNQGEQAYNEYENSTTDGQANTRKETVRQWENRAKLTNRIAWGVAAAGTITALAIVFWPTDEANTTVRDDVPAQSWTPLFAPSSDGLWLGGQIHW